MLRVSFSTSRQRDIMIGLLRKPLREVSPRLGTQGSCGICRTGEGVYDPEHDMHVCDKCRETKFSPVVELSWWSKFFDTFSLSQRCTDAAVHGIKGLHGYVRQGCGCSSRVHNRSGCKKCNWCKRGYDSPMA
jgi:hypothetical protein